jgi:hypothetical protein
VFFESIPGQRASIDILVAIVNLLSPSPDIGPVKVRVRRNPRISFAETSVHKTKKPGTAGLLEE